MHKIATGHYQVGIYHARRAFAGHWRVTVEDGRGFSFDPIIFKRLADFRQWIGA